MNRSRQSLLILFAFFAAPSLAGANMGTPLMWAGTFHLFLGNALIGLIEGWLIAGCFSLPKAKSIWIMVAANYFSAWIGLLVLNPQLQILDSATIENGWSRIWCMFAATYLMTLVLEWPFVALCFFKGRNRMRDSIKASLLAQSASYLLLFGFYWSVSGVSLFTKTQVVSAKSISFPDAAVIYYISAQDGNVYSRRFKQPNDEKIFDLASANSNDRLVVQPGAKDSRYWSLAARRDADDDSKVRYEMLLPELDVEAATEWRATMTDPPDYKQLAGTWSNFGEAARLGEAAASKWKFTCGFWAFDGLRATRDDANEKIWISYETPFGAWPVRNCTHLPGDRLLFQLGKDQICILEVNSMKLALIARGRGPVAVLARKP